MPAAPKKHAKTPARTQTHALSAADYFRAKLAFESTPHALKRAMDEGTALVLDVRPADAFAQEHIVGAENIPHAELPANYRRLPKDKTIVAYCWNITCALSTKAALELAEKGFKVQALFGGLEEWKQNGFSVESGK